MIARFLSACKAMLSHWRCEMTLEPWNRVRRRPWAMPKAMSLDLRVVSGTHLTLPMVSLSRLPPPPSVSCHVHADTMDWLRSRSGAIFPRRGVCWHCIVCCITVVYHMHYFHNCDPNRPNHRVSPAIHVPCQLMIIDLVRFRGCPVRCCLGNVRISRNGVPSSYPRSDGVRGWENPSARLY